jgi:AcrR family transcriptional regulator
VDAPTGQAPPPVATLRRDAARNRERVIAAAVEVFNDEGIDAGVEQIAHRAGVGVGTLYRRFPTKEALIAFLVEDLVAAMDADAAEALQLQDGRGLEVYLRSVAEHLARHRGCLSRMWDARRPERQDMYRARIGELLQAAQDAGTVRADVTPVELLAVGWALRGIAESADADAAGACRRHLDLVFTGLRPPAPS